MGPRLSLVLAFLVGVGCTVGAYETVRLVRTARQVLAITTGHPARSPGDVEQAPSGPAARARAARAGGTSRANAGTAASSADELGRSPDGPGGIDPAAARQASMRAMEARQAKRARLAKMAERRRALGLPEDPREAKLVRREMLKAAVMASRADAGPLPVQQAPSVPKVDTGR